MEKPTDMKKCINCRVEMPFDLEPGEFGMCKECEELRKKHYAQEGVRYDATKPDWSLIPLHLLEGTVRVLEFGAKKYNRHNWRKGLAYSRVTNSLQRHLNAFNSGEELDPETGLPHVDHILCNALFLAGMTKEHPELDDRYANIKNNDEQEQQKS